MPLPITNPVVKTATEIRRSIGRLQVYRTNNPGDELVVGGTVSALIKDLQAAYTHIPDELKEEE